MRIQCSAVLAAGGLKKFFIKNKNRAPPKIFHMLHSKKLFLLQLRQKNQRLYIMKSLIIVESPAKAKTIKNFLDKSYNVIASKGHIRDLPKTSFGIKIEDDKFTPEYRISSDHSAIVKEIKELAKAADEIYLATDEDREGEAIAFHIANAIGKEPTSLPRIVFHEITKSAIQNALSLAYPAVIYESPKRILSLVQSVANLEPEREIFAIKEATKKFETKFKDRAKNLAQILEKANLNGEWAVVISKSANIATQNITKDEIISLDIAPKAKAKLLSKITGEEVKKIYDELIKA